MAVSIDQQFIEYIVKSLVGNPEQVKVDRRIDEKGVLLELTVAQDDLGRVIGKRGATAQSLRTLLRALGTKNDARYNLKIVDVGGPRPPRDDSDASGFNNTQNDTASVQPDSDKNPSDQEDDMGTKKGKNEETSDLASRTRAELADLDDLDV
jgi:uncharacterized protein